MCAISSPALVAGYIPHILLYFRPTVRTVNRCSRRNEGDVMTNDVPTAANMCTEQPHHRMILYGINVFVGYR